MAPPSPSFSRNASSRSWDPKEVLHIIEEQNFSDKNPYFHLDIKAIRDSRKAFKAFTPDSTPEKPSKLPKLDETRAICGLTIWEGQGAQYHLVREHVSCTIRPQHRADPGERHAKVELDHPFRIYCQDLVPQSGRPASAQPYSVQITLQAESLDTPWPPLDLHKVPPPEVEVSADPDDPSGSVIKFPMLVTTYSKFPRCPSKDEEALLHLTVSQDMKQYKPKLCLQIDAKWLEPTNASETYAGWKKRKLATAPKHSSAAKRAPLDTRSVKPVVPDISIRTVWEVTNARFNVSQRKFAGYVCPLCGANQFESTELYWSHLVQSHDLFRFRVTTKCQEDGVTVKIHVKVDVKNMNETSHDDGRSREGGNLARHTRGANEGGHGEMPALRTFNTFFDLQEYLEQDKLKHWGRTKGRDRRLQQQHNGTGSRSTSAFESSARATPTIMTEVSRSAREVPNLIHPQRKKYPVPPAPDGVTFFSLRLKRPLNENELLSESDDDIDNEWLLEKQDARIDSFEDITPAEKKLIKRHDRHVLTEGVDSNLHYRESLVRFCRLNARWLRRPDIKREFARKLAALKLERVIGSSQIFDYTSIVNQESSRDDAAPSADDDDSDSISETWQSPNEASLRFYSRCAVCREPIRSLEDTQRCKNARCMRDCHIDCCHALFPSPKTEHSSTGLCVFCLGLEYTGPEGPNGSKERPRKTSQSTFAFDDRDSRVKVEDDRMVIDVDSDGQGRKDLNKLAPDPHSRLRHSRRAMTPRRYADHHSAYASPSVNGSAGRPANADPDAFPVERDRVRMGRSPVEQGSVPSIDQVYTDTRSDPVDRATSSVTPGRQLEMSRSYHGYTSAEAAGQNSTERNPRAARRPHEL